MAKRVERHGARGVIAKRAAPVTPMTHAPPAVDAPAAPLSGIVLVEDDDDDDGPPPSNTRCRPGGVSP